MYGDVGAIAVVEATFTQPRGRYRRHHVGWLLSESQKPRSHWGPNTGGIHRSTSCQYANLQRVMTSPGITYPGAFWPRLRRRDGPKRPEFARLANMLRFREKKRAFMRL